MGGAKKLMLMQMDAEMKKAMAKPAMQKMRRAGMAAMEKGEKPMKGKKRSGM